MHNVTRAMFILSYYTLVSFDKAKKIVWYTAIEFTFLSWQKKVFATGDHHLFQVLRNKANGEGKAIQKTYEM